MIGFVPAAYLVAIGDAPQESIPSDEPVVENEVSNDITSITSEHQISSEGVHRTMSADTFVRAIYGYSATSEEEMSFSEGSNNRINYRKSHENWSFRRYSETSQ